jgi:hypothetical protein
MYRKFNEDCRTCHSASFGASWTCWRRSRRDAQRHRVRPEAIPKVVIDGLIVIKTNQNERILHSDAVQTGAPFGIRISIADEHSRKSDPDGMEPCDRAECAFPRSRAVTWRHRMRANPQAVDGRGAGVGSALDRRSVGAWRSRSRPHERLLHCRLGIHIRTGPPQRQSRRSPRCCESGRTIKCQSGTSHRILARPGWPG